MVRNLDAATRDAYVRDRLVGLLADRIDGSDTLDADARAELRGRIREKPGLWRYLRVTKPGLLRIDRAKIAAETKLDGKTLLRTSELEVDAAEIARGYKALAEVERGWRDLKQLDLRPVYHRNHDRIVAHVQLSWLALLLIRTAEIACRDTWRNLAAELDRIELQHLRHRRRHRLPTHPPDRQTTVHSCSARAARSASLLPVRTPRRQTPSPLGTSRSRRRVVKHAAGPSTVPKRHERGAAPPCLPES